MVRRPAVLRGHARRANGAGRQHPSGSCACLDRRVLRRRRPGHLAADARPHRRGVPPGGVAAAARNPARPGAHVRRPRSGSGQAHGQGARQRACRGRGGRPQPHKHHRAVPPRGRYGRKPNRIRRRHRAQAAAARARRRRLQRFLRANHDHPHSGWFALRV